MKENFTAINVIIDASGSMSHLASDTIGNFNSFLKEQQEQPGEANFTLCVFNTDYRLVHDFTKIANVGKLTKGTYSPNGGTALFDAMGATIESVGRKLAAMSEEERPSKVITLIMTDGHENSSRRFTAAQIKTMVTHQQDVYSWEFVFMGANIDAITAGTDLGISIHNTLNYSATPAGIAGVYQDISTNVSSYRSSNSSRADFFNQPKQTPAVTTTTTTTTITPPSSKK